MCEQPSRASLVLLICLGLWIAAPVHAATVAIVGDVQLTVNTVTSVGHGLADGTDNTTYDVANEFGTKKLVGRLNSAMPANVTLKLQVAAPAGATSQGQVTLTGSNQDLVTGIGVVTQGGLAMNFTLSATVQANVVTAGARTLTLTLVDTP
jgi:hypothetical protein